MLLLALLAGFSTLNKPSLPALKTLVPLFVSTDISLSPCGGIILAMLPS